MDEIFDNGYGVTRRKIGSQLDCTRSCWRACTSLRRPRHARTDGSCLAGRRRRRNDGPLARRRRPDVGHGRSALGWRWTLLKAGRWCVSHRHPPWRIQIRTTTIAITHETDPFRLTVSLGISWEVLAQLLQSGFLICVTRRAPAHPCAGDAKHPPYRKIGFN
jgi:hypothetical protein